MSDILKKTTVWVRFIDIIDVSLLCIFVWFLMQKVKF